MEKNYNAGVDPGIFDGGGGGGPGFSWKCEVEESFLEVDGSSYSAFHTA